MEFIVRSLFKNLTLSIYKHQSLKFTMKNLLLIGLLLIFSCSSDREGSLNDPQIEEGSVYFPPNNSNDWETKSAASLGWKENKLPDLYNYLETKNTKSFIILYNGKIVVEKYFNDHTVNSPWYWASAGKTLTSTMAGIARDDGSLNIDLPVSNYLGTGWTSAPLVKDNLITSKNVLNMTSGLDDSSGDDVSPTDLQYKADAGTRWAYHNVYVKLQDAVANATNQTFINYFNVKLKNKIGMSGTWIEKGGLNVYYSTSRSMARFGLMIFAKGKWNDETIISEKFLNEATQTSQNINEAYGYLWWLNGRSSYHLPQTQITFPGKLIPSAPNDMYCALGKNDQKIYIVPSKKLVIIRMGESADASNFGLSDFDDVLWQKIDLVIN